MSDQAAAPQPNDEGGGAESLDPGRVTPPMVRDDPEVRALIEQADRYLDAIGYTVHGLSHVARVASRAEGILRDLEYPEREAELAAIAAYLHDIGNAIHRDGHPAHAAMFAYPILRRLGMEIGEAALTINAVANHDESNGEPVSAPTAALIIADKTDVLRSRVRNPRMISFDIHDRVNFAARSSELVVEKDRRLMTLKLDIDTSISTVMEYFEIFLSRMGITRRAATYLNCDFKLIINEVELT